MWNDCICMFVCFRHKLFSDIYNKKYFIVFLHLSSSRSLQNDTDHGLRKKREVRSKAVVFWEHTVSIKMCPLLCSDWAGKYACFLWLGVLVSIVFLFLISLLNLCWLLPFTKSWIASSPKTLLSISYFYYFALYILVLLECVEYRMTWVTSSCFREQYMPFL